MRPTKTPQSALRYPLNHILGTEASVRVLRVVLLSDIPIGVSELARQAALQTSGVARVCTFLEDLGVIESVGRGGRGRQFRGGHRFGLASQLRSLFDQERMRFEKILNDLRAAVRSLSPQCRAAWIEGPVAIGADAPGEPIVVGVLVDAAVVENARLQVWQQLLHTQQVHDVTIELRMTTIADLVTGSRQRHAELERVEPLAGPQPMDLVRAERSKRDPPSRVKPKRHEDLDLRSLEVARKIADLIRRDPSIVEETRRYLERRLPSAAPRERLELQEWEGIIASMSIPRLRRFLIEDTARATRLRQSSPFVAVMFAKQRSALLGTGSSS